MRVAGLALLIVCACFAQPTREQVLKEAMRKHALEDMEKRYPGIPDPSLTARVETIAESLGGGDIRVFVSAQPIANVLPGPIAYITTGAIEGAESDDDLASVLAHQLAHTTLPAPVLRPKSPGTIPLIFMGGPDGLCGKSSLFIPASMKPQIEEKEAEAQRIGAEMLARAGFEAIPFEDAQARIRKAAFRLKKIPSLHRARN
jgi:predicted Zn-dependent protease